MPIATSIQNIQKETSGKSTKWKGTPESKNINIDQQRKKREWTAPKWKHQQQEHEETRPSPRKIDKQNKWQELKTQKEITEHHGRQTEQEKDHKEQHIQILHKKEAGADTSERAETMEEGGRTGHCLRSQTHPQQQIRTGAPEREQQRKPSNRHYKETTHNSSSHGEGGKETQPARDKQQQEGAEAPSPREIDKQKTMWENDQT